MNAELSIDVSRPENVLRAVDASLRDSERAQIQATAHENTLHIIVTADTLAVLQGCLNSVIRYIKLAEKTLDTDGE